ncbi:MAG: tyrosine-type recombinase/integrase [Arcobacteraceae bacterium]|nr:tyrosine-type recombinase/integrase [Arcobacteraceae bacterium]
MMIYLIIETDDEKNKVCHHTLRQTFATHCVLYNDIFLVQKLLNHKDINQTLRYAKVDEVKKMKAVEKLF